MIVRFSTAARADIQSIFDYIALDNPGAAARVIGTIEQATMRLGLFPLSGRSGAVEGTRELVIPRLPYIAVYQVNSETVEVIAVFHAAQNKPRGF
jgi:toxin ParE1/3/4